MTIQDKLEKLRKAMLDHDVEAYIIFSADPHMSEYLPNEWKERSWLTGFTGSAGFAVVTKDKAGVWTDGRYFVQATSELQNSTIELMKEGVESTPQFVDWIVSEISVKGKVAVNALATSNANWELVENQLKASGSELVDLALLDTIWTDRGTPSKNEVFVHPVERAGRSVDQKLSDIRQKMRDIKANAHIISSLDDVAWTLNLRGSDVQSNPVFLAYIYLSLEEAILFVDSEKLTKEAQEQLSESKVKIEDYYRFYDFLKAQKDQTVLVASNTNQAIINSLSANNTLVKGAVPGNLMKAIKNETELAGFRTVMERDGVGMVKFLYWLTHQAGKEPLTEYSIGVKLKEFRASLDNFVGESFGSIVGYQGNAALPHYSAKKEASSDVTNEGIILVDSGGQYLEGTTDITRTLALGAVSEDFKKDSTLVLQGMIRLSMVQFPKGTKGVHLDAIARLPLWMAGKDYAHGTGHGVGSFMNVHEGPHNIRKDMNPQELLPGMVVSNEPGFYLENQYGIRHENLIAVKEVKTTDFGVFYEFETLTFCPFFKDTIVKELLLPTEIEWLNAYHKQCEAKIGPHLEGDVKDWFLELVSPL